MLGAIVGDIIGSVHEYSATKKKDFPLFAPALVAFLESTGFEDAIRNAISLGGDADTLACITGGIAEAYYGVPDDLARKCLTLLDDRGVAVVRRFRERYRLGEP